MKALTCEEFLSAGELPDGCTLAGAELEKLFWILKARAEETIRRERYWTSISDAVEHTYAELDRTRAELVRTNGELERRVAEQVGEILRQTREVEGLHAQVRFKAQERSKELLEALRRTGGRGDMAFLAPGTVIGERARIVRKLGDGGMGSVYLAEDRVTSRDVALKLLRSTDRAALSLFIAEASAANAVPHPCVVKTLHVDVSEAGHVYQLQEFVDGITLAQLLCLDPLPPPVVARVASCIAGALSAAHAHRVIHRDVKPSNVVLGPRSPGVHVLDFGIAKRSFIENPEQTSTHGWVGTPAYMSADELRGAGVITSASDVYSLGLVMFEALSGRLPFETRPNRSILLAHLAEPPPDVRDLAPDTPGDLARWIAGCLSKDPESRPSAASLERVLSGLADELLAPPSERIGADAATRIRRSEGTLAGS